MDFFNYKNNLLHAEEVPISVIAAQMSTPCYIYSRATIERHWHAFDHAFNDYPHEICYAVKANGNLAILNLLARLGSGFDIVSAGELVRVIEAKGDPAKTVFSGVGKQKWEIEFALNKGIKCFNIESEGELQIISEVTRQLGKKCSVAVRLNPDVDAKTHPYISTGMRDNKFGLAPDKALEVYKKAHQDPNIIIQGVACHIGSQLTQLDPYQDALDKVLSFVKQLENLGINIEEIDFGGGLGVTYHDESPPSPAEYCKVLLEGLNAHGMTLPVSIEPGRAIMANAGIFLTQVHYLKQGQGKKFCVVDGAMNDLLRPALYQAYLQIIEVDKSRDYGDNTYDVVGPVCESTDFLGKDRVLNVAIGSLLAVRGAGAYGAVMSSNYNARPRPAEVMVDTDQFQCIRARERLQDLYHGEQILKW